MKAFRSVTGIVAPLDRAHVDTDQIIPKQFLKSIRRTGFGPNLFDGWRYLDEGSPEKTENERQINPEFVLNKARYQDAKVLLARENFGCGSSREHAVWALEEFGLRAVLAPSFADIFYNNCFKNGVLPVVLAPEAIDALFQAADPGPLTLTVDLEAQRVSSGAGHDFGFEIDSHRRHCLLEGLDDIGLSLQYAEHIKQYERRRREAAPWLFDALR